jgi:hypothetical protein
MEAAPSMVEMTSRKPRILPLLAVLAVVSFAAGAVWASSGGPSAASPVPAALNCASLTLPQLSGEVNTVLDKERGLLTISFIDEQTAINHSVTIAYRDPSCLAEPNLRRVIAHAVDTDAAAQVQICASMRDLVTRNATVVRGVRVDPAAGRKYLADWC